MPPNSLLIPFIIYTLKLLNIKIRALRNRPLYFHAVEPKNLAATIGVLLGLY